MADYSQKYDSEYLSKDNDGTFQQKKSKNVFEYLDGRTSPRIRF